MNRDLRNQLEMCISTFHALSSAFTALLVSNQQRSLRYCIVDKFQRSIASGSRFMDVLLQSDTCPNETLLLIEGAAVFRFARKTPSLKIEIKKTNSLDYLILLNKIQPFNYNFKYIIYRQTITNVSIDTQQYSSRKGGYTIINSNIEKKLVFAKYTKQIS